MQSIHCNCFDGNQREIFTRIKEETEDTLQTGSACLGSVLRKEHILISFKAAPALLSPPPHFSALPCAFRELL